MFTRASIKRLLAVTALAVAALPLCAQTGGGRNNLPRNLFPPSLLPPPKLSAEEQATIDRALADLHSGNSEFRAGAVMLLGKYPVAQAQKAVIAALGDDSVRVRRAALVSVMEWNRGAPAEAVVPVLRTIGDEDVELRRTASAAIPAMMDVKRATEVLQPGTQFAVPADVQQTLMDAYLDEDVIVRRNLLTNYYYLNLPVSGDTFLALMSDEDAQVRLEAVGLAARFAEPASFNREARRWIENGSRIERLRLTRELALKPDAAQLELLRLLSQDEDDEIAAEALLGRFRSQGADAVFDELNSRLQAKRLKQEQALRFLQLLRQHPSRTPAHITTLTQLDDPILRREAVDLFFDLGYARDNPEQGVQFLADPSPEVRAAALRNYERQGANASPELLDTMLASPYPDVRQTLVFMTGTMQDKEAVEAILFDLLLDEEIAIRQQSLQEIAKRRLDGWEDILTASLEDEDPFIQRNAADLIIRTQMPGGPSALRQYIQHHPKSPLTPLIQIYLDKSAAGQSKETP
ncbi:HEAT repeat domain-containing protein [Ruficoccus amylovorans]|uniref:HEAT repeat domain-containing protein n=1 Tax=Ruficoccus amylovorans TaxID=1804625 RepID=A0A842HGL4_9BACT|nr:HEAT repeat domain-containing protein [Ruficoccus amylovorans]MBC2595562.1 HEAT repeat domain-containing protein [Ruficoccus amylovorans]